MPPLLQVGVRSSYGRCNINRSRCSRRHRRKVPPARSLLSCSVLFTARTRSAAAPTHITVTAQTAVSARKIHSPSRITTACMINANVPADVPRGVTGRLSVLPTRYAPSLTTLESYTHPTDQDFDLSSKSTTSSEAYTTVSSHILPQSMFEPLETQILTQSMATAATSSAGGTHLPQLGNESTFTTSTVSSSILHEPEKTAHLSKPADTRGSRETRITLAQMFSLDLFGYVDHLSR
jgi:hypothetical protein